MTNSTKVGMARLGLGLLRLGLTAGFCVKWLEPSKRSVGVGDLRTPNKDNPGVPELPWHRGPAGVGGSRVHQPRTPSPPCSSAATSAASPCSPSHRIPSRRRAAAASLAGPSQNLRHDGPGDPRTDIPPGVSTRRIGLGLAQSYHQYASPINEEQRMGLAPSKMGLAPSRTGPKISTIRVAIRCVTAVRLGRIGRCAGFLSLPSFVPPCSKQRPIYHRLYLEHDDSEPPLLYNPEDASTTQLKAYRSYMLGDEYLGHSFFSLDNTESWIALVPFQAYMALAYGAYRTTDSTPFSSRAPSRAASSMSLAGSRASSRMSFLPSSGASSPVSLAPSDLPSHLPSSMSIGDVIVIDDSDDNNPSENQALHATTPMEASNVHPHAPIPKVERPMSPSFSSPRKAAMAGKRKGKARSDPDIIKITRELGVNAIIPIATVPDTWTVPITPTAYLVDVLGSKALLTVSGKVLSLDTFIRAEDQKSWRGSTGRPRGDVQVRGLTPDLNKKVLCRRCQFYCNGVDTCKFIDPDLFAGCKRYEPDYEAMKDLWNHELDSNEGEAASATGIIARFYTHIVNSKCKVRCDGVPTLIRRSRGAPVSGQTLFVGCSKWSRAQKFDHVYWSIPANVDEQVLQFVMENDGLLPMGEITENETCVLTVHPRVGLKHCPFSHIIRGRIMPGKITKHLCDTEMLIFLPVDAVYAHKALVVLRNPHNHPVHPKTKPSVRDRLQLGEAVQAAGLTGLTHHPHPWFTRGGRVSESSPAFTDQRKLRDFITEQKKKEHPYGMGWEGVLHHLNTREIKLLKDSRYIHTAMSKNGFHLVVTMHPEIASFIHLILSVHIDYTFKRVEGTMDEWEVAGFLDRFKYRLTFASLYCDKKSLEAFDQLFGELFDTIQQVTGEKFKLAPFFPDAKCRIIMMDGEVPQAQGLAKFLGTYNDPEISGLWTRDAVKLLNSCLKTCNPHFERHLDELPMEISKPVILRLKSIMSLSTQEDIDKWHQFCRDQKHEAIINWYAHKLANPWVLPSVNKFLSNIKPEDWDITPSHSNYVETAHAGRNAETSVGVGLLTAILQAQERDDIRAAELAQIQRDGVMRNRWNGSSEREKLSAQRKVWKIQKAAVRNDQLTSYDTLKLERDTGSDENKASLERQKMLDSQIKSLQEEMKLDAHRTDLRERINELRRDVDAEKSLRREWNVRRSAIDVELEQLRKGPLAGARIKGRRPTQRPSGEDSSDLEDRSDIGGTDFTGPGENYGNSELDLLHDESLNTALDPSSSFSADLTAFEESLFGNPSGSSGFDLAQFLGDVDPSTLDLTGYNNVALGEYNGDWSAPALGWSASALGVNTGEVESGEDTNWLEYAGPPAVDHLGTDSDMFDSSATGGELPHLPPPSAPSPSTTAADQPLGDGAVDVDDEPEEHPIAPQDIDLELDPRNIIPGKRQRTASTRATDAADAASRPAKK
ncbi:hypothetical protein DFH09DRAFT_1439289 [Mycena vulgaris]|nr:hypothetical protein DFH09DRAFT_1439289 [Mycena vulgaris]